MDNLRSFNRKEVEKLASRQEWGALAEYDLASADLSGMDFFGADLRCCDLSGADLSMADLRYADLSETDLSKADLTDAFLEYADLSEADLEGACFFRAKLRDSNLSWADLTDADLKYADLSGADLSGANLNYADLSRAALTDVITSEDTEWLRMQCPEKGTFIGFKKAYDGSGQPYIVKLLIPAHAKRSSATTGKCRCSEAKALSISTLGGTDAGVETVYSWFDEKFAYAAGGTVKADSFNMDRWTECTNGIHFFMTRGEAVNYIF